MNTATKGEIHRWRAFAVLAVSFFMTIVDLTIANVALPTIGRELHFFESNPLDHVGTSARRRESGGIDS